MEFKRHNVEWTDEKVGRFWDFLNNYNPFQDEWFTKQVGDAILTFVCKYCKINGKILDYGAGKGYLSQLLSREYPVNLWGCDFSEEAVKYNNTLLKNEKNYEGCIKIKEFPSDIPNDQFDLIFLIEAIEHLNDNYFNSTLNEIQRILKPGGKLIITTPNNENLEKSHVICPDCGCIFHRMQHIRRFDKNSLIEIISKFKIDIVFCDGINLFDYKKKTIIKKLIRFLKNIYSKERIKPHLVFIGTKNI